MKTIKAILWPSEAATGGTTPSEIAALMREIEVTTKAKIVIAAPKHPQTTQPQADAYLIVHHTFLRGSILAYETAVAQGTTDSAKDFAQFTSTFVGDFVNFRHNWIAKRPGETVMHLNLAELEAKPKETLEPILQQIAPHKFKKAGSADRPIRQMASTIEPLMDRLNPNKFRHRDPDLFTALRALKLPRDVVVETFRETMERDIPEDQIIALQASPSVPRLKEALMKSAEYIKRFGLTDAEVRTSYKMFLNREPSQSELDRMKAAHLTLEHLRKAFMTSPEFSREYAAYSKDGSRNDLASPHRPTAYKTPPRLQPANVDRVVFLHIPKCGGTTLHNMLCHWFQPENVHPERFNSLYGYTAASLASSVVFSGHYDHYATSLIPGPKKMISFLRDPIDRLISLYNFHRAHSPAIIKRDNLELPRWANEYDIDAYFAHEAIRIDPAVNNTMVRYFSDVPQIPQSKHSGHFRNVTMDEMLEQALRNLEKFAFIGFMDQYEADLNRLADTLDCKRPAKVRKAQVLDDLMDLSPDMQKITKQKPSDITRTSMEDLVAYDQIFYARARELFL